jgi:hypothetical protein
MVVKVVVSTITSHNGCMTDYDSWLEQPYQDQYAWDDLCEQYEGTDQHKEDLAEWLAENPDMKAEDFWDYCEDFVRRWADP